MNRLRMFLVAAALMTAGSALATAQPFEHDGRRDGDRNRYERHYDRGDRDDRRFDWGARRSYDRDDRRYFVGERRSINGYYWTWDGSRWCRRDNGISLYFGF